MNTKSLLGRLSKKFPKRIANKWHDHVGLMAGKLPENINKILLCLDFDEEVYPIAIKEKPDLILTHHPFIYGAKRKVFKFDPKKETLFNKIEKAGIPVYSMHTNFDEGKDGMNDALAEKLCLKNIYQNPLVPMMRIGFLEKPMPIMEFAKIAKESLDVPYGHLIIGEDKKVAKIGIIGGGGGGYYWHAQQENCDLYISGDAPHHTRRAIVRDKMNYLDLPHEIERIFMPQMKKVLLNIDPTLKIVIVDHEKCPKTI